MDRIKFCYAHKHHVRRVCADFARCNLSFIVLKSMRPTTRHVACLSFESLTVVEALTTEHVSGSYYKNFNFYTGHNAYQRFVFRIAVKIYSLVCSTYNSDEATIKLMRKQTREQSINGNLKLTTDKLH